MELQRTLIDELNDFQRMVHATARAKGFYKNQTTFAHKIALAHEELSEALREDRKNLGDTDTYKRGKIGEELADCIIRILDMAEAHRLPVVEKVFSKAEFNKTRPMLHGKLY